MKLFLRDVVAGVLVWSVLAMPLEALIVYTPLQTQIVNNGQDFVDLNRDGVADFKIDLSAHGQSGVCGRGQIFWSIRSYIYPTATTNAIVVSAHGQARLLSQGTEIDASSNFESSGETIYQFLGCGTSRHVSGYLGLKFVANGQTHYAWTYVSIDVDATRQRVSLTVTGFAYESIHGRGIQAGQTFGA